jgi:hypothetical protein
MTETEDGRPMTGDRCLWLKLKLKLNLNLNLKAEIVN